MIRTARDPAATAEQLQACAGQGDAIDRLLAKHPNASAQLLELLSHSSDRATRKAVTLHPNTPKDALLKLAPQFPGDFFQNPAFDWLLIEHPNLMFDIGGGVLKNVLKRAECPQSFMAWAATHGSEQERLAVAMNPQAQADVLQAIERKGGKAAQAAQQHANHPLASGDGDLESAFRKAVEQAIAEGFDAIQSTTSVGDLPTLAQWPALSVAKRLESSYLTRDCVDIAVHPQAPPALAEPILNAMAASTHEGARWEVADNPGTPAAILAKLSDDSDKEVRRAARATRRTVETTIDTRLAFDSSCDGSFGLLCEPDTPAEVVSQRLTSACEDAHRLVFDCKRSSWWTRSVAKLKPKDADLIQACNAGDVLYLPDRLAEKACRKTNLAWRVLGLSHRLASPEDLAKRSRSTEWVERMAVARNPNTPPNIIEALRKDPHRLVARKAEATAALKSGAAERQSQLLQEMPVAATDPTEQAIVEEASVRLKKLSRPNLILYGSRWASCLAPGQWLTVLGASTQAQLERMLPHSLKLAMAEFWADPAIPKAEFRAVSLPPGVLALLAQISRKKAVQERIPLKANVPAAALIRLASSRYPDVRANVARRAGTPSDVLATLSNDPVSWVRSMAVMNPAAPIQTLTRLADDADVYVRCGVAANLTTPADFLGKLAGDADEDVRGAVAANPSTSAASLAMLAGDSRSRVRCAAAENISAPHAILGGLAGDTDAGVRIAVAANPATMADTLSRLGRDTEAVVRERVAMNPASTATTLHTLFGDSSAPVRCAAAGNPSAPADVLVVMASDSDGEIRGKVAANPATPAGVLSALAGDSDCKVRREVAKNSATPAAVLATLGGDSDSDVCQAVAHHPATPAAIRCAVLTELASDGNWFRRWEVAKNSGTPPDFLRTLARDVKWEVCLSAVSNPSAPEDILIAQVEDARADACLARRFLDLSRALSAESPTPEQSAVIQSWIAELQAGLAEPVVLKDVSDSEFRLAFDALGLMPSEGDKRAIAKAAKSKDWLERAAATYAPGIQPSLLKVLLEDPVEAVRQCAVARLRVVGT